MENYGILYQRYTVFDLRNEYNIPISFVKFAWAFQKLFWLNVNFMGSLLIDGMAHWHNAEPMRSIE